jgi:hypothetical protein
MKRGILVLLSVVSAGLLWPAQARGVNAPPEPFIELKYRGEAWRHQRMLAVKPERLRSFERRDSDLCSGGVSAAWARLRAAGLSLPPHVDAVEACCFKHDGKYYLPLKPSDARESFDARLKADRDFHRCLANTGDPAAAGRAYIMYKAVRFGGRPCTGMSWRWGFGRKQC